MALVLDVNILVVEGSVDLSLDASLTYAYDGRFSFVVLAVRSVWQYYVPVADVLRLLDLFRRMVNDSLRIGLLNDASSLRKLSLLSYNQLAIRQTTRTQALVRKMPSSNGPRHGCS